MVLLVPKLSKSSCMLMLVTHMLCELVIGCDDVLLGSTKPLSRVKQNKGCNIPEFSQSVSDAKM
jgi:hypothetical protein